MSTGMSWVRLDANLPNHDKVLRLLSDPSPKRWQAMTSYVFALAWSGGTGTDGFIPNAALPVIHGTSLTARLLVKHGFWDEATAGYSIRNWQERQPTHAAWTAAGEAKKRASRKGNCVRHHGPDCGCWKSEGSR
jgi:hypothetical protein